MFLFLLKVFKLFIETGAPVKTVEQPTPEAVVQEPVKKTGVYNI